MPVGSGGLQRAVRRSCAAHLGAGHLPESRWRGFRSISSPSVSAGPPSGGLYLKPPSSGGLCDGRDHDAIGQACPRARGCTSGWRAKAPASACSRGRCRSSSRRRWPPALRARWPMPARESACVSMARNSGPVVPCCLPVFADGLRDRQDVVLVERERERRAAVPRCAERHALRRRPRDRAVRCNRPSTSRGTFTSIEGWAGLPAFGSIGISLIFAPSAIALSCLQNHPVRISG